MSYADELCQLVIKNMEIIEEAPKVVEHVEKRLFAAINARIEKAVRAQKNWNGCYDLVTDNDDKETTFAPSEWPEDEDGSYMASYTLHYMEEGEGYAWLSVATGVHGSALRLQFGLERHAIGTGAKVSVKEYKKFLHDFYNKTPVLAEAGFQITKDGIIYLPFALDASKLAEEYPSFAETLEPLDNALKTLFKEHYIFDSFIKSFYSAK